MILQLKNITKSFGSLNAVDNVSCDIEQGETFAIVGESGCGKTTLARIMVGLMHPTSGEIITEARLQMVFQDPFSSLDPLYTVRAILSEAFYGVKNVSAQEKLNQIAAILTSVGLTPDILDRFPHEFSGGQRQRIAIARALLTRPSVLVLDEPTSALDVLVQKQILDLLSTLKSKFGLTYIFISHNLRVVKHFSDRIAVMHKGQMVEMGKANDVFVSPKHAYTKELLSAALT